MSQFYNAATAIVTVYSPEGTAVECTRLNANDLVRLMGYTWGPDIKDEDVPEEVVAIEEEAILAAITDAVVTTESNSAPDSELSLEELAMRLTGESVEDYLSNLSGEALHTLAQERFSIKLHHRLSKDSLIEKIVELEDQRLAATDAAE